MAELAQPFVPFGFKRLEPGFGIGEAREPLPPSDDREVSRREIAKPTQAEPQFG